MKPLSEQLSDLSKRAKQAEEDYAAAQTEARDKVEARVTQMKADAATRKANTDAAVTAKKDKVAEHWAAMRKQIQERFDSADADVATWNADRAEENAAEAIAFALMAIDYAERAVLDAAAVRADAAARADTVTVTSDEQARHA